MCLQVEYIIVIVALAKRITVRDNWNSLSVDCVHNNNNHHNHHNKICVASCTKASNKTRLLTALAVFLLLVKEATLTNEKLRQVVTRQKTVITDQLSQITQLQQDLTSTRGSLGQLRAECEHQNTEKDQLISSLRLELHAVSL